MTGIVQIYTGSACKEQPGEGAWATLLACNGHEKEMFGSTNVTTNNRMALIAAIKGLRCLKSTSAVHIFTPSQYMQRGAREWLPKWKADGRLQMGGVENAELWTELDRLLSLHFVDWIWTRADDDPTTRRVCELAKTTLYSKHGAAIV